MYKVLFLPSKKRVLFITNTLYSFGGGERWALETAKRLGKAYEISMLHYVSQHGTSRITQEYIAKQYGLGPKSIITLKGLGLTRTAFGEEPFTLAILLPGSILRLRKAISEADVIYLLSFNPVLFTLSVRFAAEMNKKLIFGAHNPLFANIFKSQPGVYGHLSARYKASLRKVKAFHVINDEDARLVRSNYPNTRVYQIPNFVIHQKQKRLIHKSFVAVFVGRLNVNHKGLDLLNKVIDRVLSENLKIKFRIFGSGGDGEELVKSIVGRHRGNVAWPGFLEDKALSKEYNSASLLVFPSRFESFGLSLIEAQAYGLPAVAFNVKGPKDIMKKSFQGALVSPFDVEAFARSVLNYYDLWHSDRKAYERLRGKISSYVLRTYSDKVIVARIRGMLDSV